MRSLRAVALLVLLDAPSGARGGGVWDIDTKHLDTKHLLDGASKEVEKTIKDKQTDQLVAKVKQVAPEVASKVSHEDAAAKAIEKTQKVLAPAMDSKVVGAVSSAVEKTTESGIRDVLPPQVATAINSTHLQKGIEVAKGMAPKVAKAIRKTDPQMVEQVVAAGTSRKTYEEVIEAVNDIDWWSKNWMWVSLGLLSSVFMAFAVCGLCKMAKRRRQGPPLMMDANINMYLRAEGQQNGAENMFTRF